MQASSSSKMDKENIDCNRQYQRCENREECFQDKLYGKSTSKEVSKHLMTDIVFTEADPKAIMNKFIELFTKIHIELKNESESEDNDDLINNFIVSVLVHLLKKWNTLEARTPKIDKKLKKFTNLYTNSGYLRLNKKARQTLYEVCITTSGDIFQHCVSLFYLNVPKSEITEKIKDDIKHNKMEDAAILTQKYDLFAEVDTDTILSKLLATDKYQQAVNLANCTKLLQPTLINLITTKYQKYMKQAPSLIKQYKLNPHDYPAVIEQEMTKCLNFYLYRNTKYEKYDKEHVDIYKIEELFSGYDKILVELVERIVLSSNMCPPWMDYYERLNEAKLISERNKITNFLSYRARIAIDNVKIDKEKLKERDVFGPLSEPKEEHYTLKIDESMVYTIDTTDKLAEVQDKILSSAMVGIDAEWRPNLTTFQECKVDLLQISTHEEIFLIDFLKLGNEDGLASFMNALFDASSVLKIGFGFKSDLKMLKSYKNISQKINSLVDVQDFYCGVTGNTTASLMKVSEELLGRKICKAEQMSNWERRPLKKSQIHYAALDSYILLDVYEALVNITKEKDLDPCIYHQDIDTSKKPKKEKEKRKEHETKESKQVTNYSGYANTVICKGVEFTCLNELYFLTDYSLTDLGHMLRSKGTGFDTQLMQGEMEAMGLLQIAYNSWRILITSNYRIYEMATVPCIYVKKRNQAQEELADIVNFLQIDEQYFLYPRCFYCNVDLSFFIKVQTKISDVVRIRPSCVSCRYKNSLELA